MRAMGRSARGVTLLEAMVVVAVMAVCLCVALPSLVDALRAQRVRAASSELLDALRLARLEALRLGLPVRLCPSSAGLACEPGARWEQGWVALADEGPARVLAVGAPRPGVRIDSDPVLARGARFDAAGWPRQPGGALLMGRWRVCPAGDGPARVAGRELVMSSGGRLREAVLDCANAGSTHCRPASR